MKTRAALVSTLAVGTEITDGQIADRNSQWLSSRMLEHGYEIYEHRAVPDDREHILKSLKDLARVSKVILVTGGLGPTSDDFTRECVAEFLGQPLEWDETSWGRILDRLRARGAAVTDNQKQQCYFPRGAKILLNTAGTANAFTATTADGVRIVSLPGPPAEIEAIWNEGLNVLLKPAQVAEVRALTLLRTMGLGEGALASRVEEIIDGVMSSHAEIHRPAVGYRAHAPYVEIKLWADSTQALAVAKIAQTIRTVFHDILVNEGLDDVADAFLERVRDRAKDGAETLLVDRVTRGEFLTRVLSRARDLKSADVSSALSDSFSVYVTGMWSDDKNASVVSDVKRDRYVLEIGQHELELVLKNPSGAEKRITFPKLAVSLRSERGRKWAIETALREWGTN